MAEAAGFFNRLLLESEQGSAAHRYLKDRGISDATIERFRLGYSPSTGDGLIQHLQKRGFALAALIECGLAKRSEDGVRCYDAFRGRVMFPIADIRGRVIAFGGRAMGDHQPKYLNSPETRLYNKSRNLFGLNASREAIKRDDCAILVEGYMDFIVPFQYGVENLVASLGTSLTPHQVQLLGRYTREVVVSYDPDSAGVSAAQRSLDLFLEEDFRVRVLCLPAGQDPDEFVRKAGAAEYRARVGESVSYLDFVLETAIQGQGSLDNPRSKIQILNSVLPYLAKLSNAVERSEYVFRFARRLGLEDQQLLAEVRKAAQQRKGRIAEPPAASLGAMKVAEKRLLQCLLNNTELQAVILPSCSTQDFDGLAAQRIFVEMLDAFGDRRLSTFEGLHRRFAGEPEQVLLAQLQMEEIPEEFSRETAESFYSALHALTLASYKRQILAEIDVAAQRKDDELLNRLIEQRVLVDRELLSLSRK
jgi:DNA primase catalytic core